MPTAEHGHDRDQQEHGADPFAQQEMPCAGNQPAGEQDQIGREESPSVRGGCGIVRLVGIGRHGMSIS